MRPVNDVEKLFMMLHLLHWLPGDSLLFQMTLERLQEPTVMGSIYGVIAMHSCFVQVINRTSEPRQRLKHWKHQFGDFQLR